MTQPTHSCLAQVYMPSDDQKTWGPSVWACVHLMCMGAPATINATQAAHYKAFFDALGHILPCEACQEHYRELLDELRGPLETALGKGDLFEWSVRLHNEVNAALGKPQMSLERARAIWSTPPTIGSNPWSATAVVVVVATAVALAVAVGLAWRR